MRKALILLVLLLVPACDKSEAQSDRTPTDVCNDMWQHYVAVGNIMQTHMRNCDMALNQLFAYTNQHQTALQQLRKEADEMYTRMRKENNVDPSLYQLKQNIQSFNRIEHLFQNFCFDEDAMFRKEFRLW